MKDPDPRARWAAVEGWLDAAGEDRKPLPSCLATDSPRAEAPPFIASRRSKNC